VAFHAYKDVAGRPGWDGPLGTFAYALQWAVPVFFVLSGFLLYRPFAVAIATESERPSAGRFLLRRAARIFPAYWLALAAFGTLTAAETLWSPDGIVRYGLLLQVFDTDTVYHVLGTAWSLSIEVTFYLVLPALAWAVSRLLGTRPGLIRHLAIVAGIAAAGIVVREAVLAPIYAAAGTDPGLVGFTLPGSIEPFAAGMALAVVTVSRFEAFALARRAPRLVRTAVVGLDRRDGPWLALALLAFSLGLVFEARHISPWQSTDFATLAAVALLAPVVLRPRASPIARLLGGSAPLVGLGAVSYGLYLWHWPIQELIRTHGFSVDASIPGWALAFVVNGSLGIGAAILSYRFLERPINERVRAMSAGGADDPSEAGGAVGGLESGPVGRLERGRQSVGRTAASTVSRASGGSGTGSIAAAARTNEMAMITNTTGRPTASPSA
jgi:peptidoglycan/LPS O-acetylase OafA/YrhL